MDRPGLRFGLPEQCVAEIGRHLDHLLGRIERFPVVRWWCGKWNAIEPLFPPSLSALSVRLLTERSG